MKALVLALIFAVLLVSGCCCCCPPTGGGGGWEGWDYDSGYYYRSNDVADSFTVLQPAVVAD